MKNLENGSIADYYSTCLAIKQFKDNQSKAIEEITKKHKVK